MQTIRHIFPKRSECPTCKCRRWNRRGSKGSMRYRQCQHCRRIYRVAPIGREVDDGSAWSRILPC